MHPVPHGDLWQCQWSFHIIVFRPVRCWSFWVGNSDDEFIVCRPVQRRILLPRWIHISDAVDVPARSVLPARLRCADSLSSRLLLRGSAGGAVFVSMPPRVFLPPGVFSAVNVLPDTLHNGRIYCVVCRRTAR